MTSIKKDKAKFRETSLPTLKPVANLLIEEIQ